MTGINHKFAWGVARYSIEEHNPNDPKCREPGDTTLHESYIDAVEVLRKIVNGDPAGIEEAKAITNMACGDWKTGAHLAGVGRV